MTTERYRLFHGEIQTRIWPDHWVQSAHDTATADEVEDYEAEGHEVAPFLRQKFFGAGQRSAPQ